MERTGCVKMLAQSKRGCFRGKLGKSEAGEAKVQVLG